jgi:hypothetical protein
MTMIRAAGLIVVPQANPCSHSGTFNDTRPDHCIMTARADDTSLIHTLVKSFEEREEPYETLKPMDGVNAAKIIPIL